MEAINDLSYHRAIRFEKLAMHITLEIPDELVSPLVPPGYNPARTVLKALALEAYRQRRLGEYQLQTLLGISSRYELDGFLKEHGTEKYTVEDFEHNLATLAKLAASIDNCSPGNSGDNRLACCGSHLRCL
jgi:Uncharacterised protein family (UPF0175)